MKEIIVNNNDSILSCNSEFGLLRSVVIDKEPYFLMQDVCNILGYNDLNITASNYIKNNNQGIIKLLLPNNLKTVVINKYIIYDLGTKSSKQSAKKFTDWIMGCVLSEFYIKISNNELLSIELYSNPIQSYSNPIQPCMNYNQQYMNTQQPIMNSNIPNNDQNNINVFNNPEFGSIRSIIINGEPWFVGKDIAIILGYSNPLKAIRDHVMDNDKGVNKLDTPGGSQNIIIINESGLYSLIFSSKLSKAKEFQHWVTSEVLPSINLIKYNSLQQPICFNNPIQQSIVNNNIPISNNQNNIFNNSEFGNIRIINENGNILFCASDIAKALGYTNPRKAILDHCKGVTKRDTPTSGGIQEINFITESDVYRLIAHSKLPKAMEFEKWIFEEVLPSIRKHGVYATSNFIEQTMADPDYAIRVFTELKKEREARIQAQQQIEQQEPLVYFANKVANSCNLIDMNTMAKVLKDENIDIGRNKLFSWLRNKNILMKDNLPYQRYINEGYFQVKEAIVETPYGAKTSYVTMITGKGQIYITELLRKEYNS